jgi:hypothetical protein
MLVAVVAVDLRLVEAQQVQAAQAVVVLVLALLLAQTVLLIQVVVAVVVDLLFQVEMVVQELLLFPYPQQTIQARQAEAHQ